MGHWRPGSQDRPCSVSAIWVCLLPPLDPSGGALDCGVSRFEPRLWSLDVVIKPSALKLCLLTRGHTALSSLGNSGLLLSNSHCIGLWFWLVRNVETGEALDPFQRLQKWILKCQHRSSVSSTPLLSGRASWVTDSAAGQEWEKIRSFASLQRLEKTWLVWLFNCSLPQTLECLSEHQVCHGKSCLACQVSACDRFVSRNLSLG